MFFYTYLYLRKDGTPYYVGKGRGYRAYVKRGRVISPPTNKELILTQDFPTEEDAFAAEQFLIAYYGRKDLGTGLLHNRTAGGEGTSGFARTISPAQREEHRQFMSGRLKTKSHRQHLSAAAKDRWSVSSSTNNSRRENLRQLSRTSQPFANHTRWHIQRGIQKSDCSFCAVPS